MDDTKLLDQAEHISDIFTRVMQRITADEVIEEVADGITPAQFHAMRYIAQHGPSSIGRIAEGLCISQPAATMLVDRMVKRGLVERQVRRADRRQAEVSLTPRAMDLLAELERERIERLGRVLQQMGTDDRLRFVQSLEQFVAAALRAEGVPGEACLRCGMGHHTDCVVDRVHYQKSGKHIERT